MKRPAVWNDRTGCDCSAICMVGSLECVSVREDAYVWFLFQWNDWHWGTKGRKEGGGEDMR